MAVGVAAAFATAILLKLWHADLAIPPYYADGGDVLSNLAWAKSFFEHGNIYNSPLIDAPLGGATYEFPYFCASQLPLQIVLNFITGNPFVAFNLLYFLAIPAQALAAFYAMRRLAINSWIAFAPAVLFALVPRFAFGEQRTDEPHFWIIPFSALMCILLARGTVRFGERHGRWPRITRDGWYLVGLALLTGFGNAYYAGFTVALLVVAVGIAAAKEQSARPLLVGAILSLVIAFGFAVQLMPTLVYKFRAGANTLAFTRYPQDAQVYGLQIAQLVLPIPGHRGGTYLADQRAYFDARAPNAQTESAGSSLGTVGTVGFIALIAAVFLRFSVPLAYDIENLALLNLWTVLVSTVSGFGALFNYYVSPNIRAYNRFSVFIAFFALAGIGQILTYVATRWRWSMPVFARAALVTGLIAFGAWDQTSADVVPPYAQSAAQFQSDATFVAAVESHIGSGAAFELPYMRYPETTPVGSLIQGNLFRIYLHAKTLRTSYGAVEGRDPYAWQQRVGGEAPAELIRSVMLGGFDGLIVFRAGYADNGVALESQLQMVLGHPLISPDQSLAFYSLKTLRDRAIAADPEIGTTWFAERTVRSIRSILGPALAAEAQGTVTLWNARSTPATISVRNSSTRTRPLELGAIADLGPTPNALHIVANGTTRTYAGGPQPVVVDFPFDALPGDTTIHLTTSAQPWPAPGEPEPLAFRFTSPAIYASDRPEPSPAAEAIFAQALAPIAPIEAFGTGRIRLLDGCSALEIAGGNRWNWCGRSGDLRIESTRPARLTFSATVVTPGLQTSRLDMEAAGHRTVLTIMPNGTRVNVTVDVSPRRPVSISFQSDARPVVADDPRTLVVQFIDPELH